MEKTVSEKLEALEHLQSIDSNLDDIRKVRGDLPEEVKDLEDEIAGYETRVKKFENEISDLNSEISGHKTDMKTSDKLIKKYEEQQMNVRNNREYDAISKEVELQNLEIQISEKKIREANFKIDRKKEEIKQLKGTLDERRKDLDNKNKELEVIIGESEGDEEELLKKREQAEKEIEDRLLYSYDRIRKNARNGLAVVSVRRDACGGCFNQVPPQRQADIRERKKIIVCEHCGRILSDVESVENVEV
ncbi:MAG: C4-type zinc ribbon domain-containing protein [Catalinimonas sp.]